MLKSTLLEILRTFTREENREFRRFVNSPLFNTKTSVIKLWEIISKYAPAYGSLLLEREAVYEKIFPEKKYNYGTMKNLVYDLTNLAEKYLEFKGLEKAGSQRNIALLNELLDKSLLRRFHSKYTALENKIKKDSVFYDNYYLDRYSLGWVKSDYEIYMSAQDKGNQNIYRTSNNLIFSFLIDYFKIYNNLTAQNIEHIADEKFDPGRQFLQNFDIDNFISSVKQSSEFDHKVISLYYSMFKALTNNDDIKYYRDFKQTLEENGNILSQNEKRNLYTCLGNSLINYRGCEFIDKISEYHQINTKMDSLDLILYGTTLGAKDYASAIRYAAIMKDVQFIEKFMKRYLPILPKEQRDGMKKYSMAFLHFSKNEFEKALEYVVKTNIDFSGIKYALKNLQLMLFYELGDFESFYYTSDSFKHFLTNNKSISDRISYRYIKFIKYVDDLLKLRENYSRPGIVSLIDEIKRDHAATQRWLIEKAEELENKN
jgi:hypothetical protein